MSYTRNGKTYAGTTAWALYETFNPSEGYSLELQNKSKYLLANFPVLGGFVRSLDNMNYMNDYLKNRGLSWTDVRYASRLSGSGSLGSGGLNYVSSNIYKLYNN